VMEICPDTGHVRENEHSPLAGNRLCCVSSVKLDPVNDVQHNAVLVNDVQPIAAIVCHVSSAYVGPR
jgi:hypothetical protein